MLEGIVRWVAIAVLLIGIAIAVNALFPLIRGHIAMGVAAGLLLFVIYAIRSFQE